MAHQAKDFPNLKDSQAVSEKTNSLHKDKLYAGYVNKRNEIEEKINKLNLADLEAGNQIYSAIRGLSEGETFAANGMILHEIYFPLLGGNGQAEGTEVYRQIVKDFGSWERFVAELTAKSMAARGWAILAWDPSDNKLHLYTADAQNQGAVWGCTPLMAVDVYEHAYFLDYGSDRKAYIKAFLKEVNWQVVEQRFVALNK